MIQVYPDAVCLQTLEDLIANDVHIFIFTNNITPDEDTVVADFTLQSSFDETVPDADFLFRTVVGHVASVMAGPVGVVNASGGAVNAYGYVITEEGDPTKMLACARFDSAPVAVPNGDTLPIVPMLSALWAH